MNKKTAAPTQKQSHNINVSDLLLTDEPFTARNYQVSKYDDFFATVSKNKRVSVPTGKGAAIGRSLVAWLNNHVCENAWVSVRETCADGRAGVWWLGEIEEREAKRKANKPTKPATSKNIWKGLQ